jgi:hypothetical protein
MYDELKSRVASLLARPRTLKPQTQRQLSHHLAEHSSSMTSFLTCAASALEEHELDILFGPVFTPTLDERAEVADVLYHWRPTAEQLAHLVTELAAEVPYALVRLPDETEAQLTLHEVMVDRFVRLLRLDAAPDAATAAALRDALPAALWPVAVALCCERGMTPAHQKWFVAFVNHMSSRRAASREMLEAVVEFLAGQTNLQREALLASAEALMRATEGTAAYASGGHAYWSPDVAQHHQYRGEGKIDQEKFDQQQAEVERVTAIVEDLRTFLPSNQ